MDILTESFQVDFISKDDFITKKNIDYTGSNTFVFNVEPFSQ